MWFLSEVPKQYFWIGKPGCFWNKNKVSHSRQSSWQKELLEETKGYVDPLSRPSEDSKKRAAESRRKTQKTTTGTCLEKRHVKARNEKTETGKIGERRKKICRKLLALESHDMRLVCHLQAAICFSADVHMILEQVVSTAILTSISCDVMFVAPAPGFSEFFAPWLSQSQEYCLCGCCGLSVFQPLVTQSSRHRFAHTQVSVGVWSI